MSSQVFESLGVSARELYKLIQCLERLSITHNFGSYFDPLSEVLGSFTKDQPCCRVRQAHRLSLRISLPSCALRDTSAPEAHCHRLRSAEHSPPRGSLGGRGC